MTIKLYGTVNGLSEKIEKLYGSINGLSKEVVKLYGSVNGLSKLIYKANLYGTVYYKTNPTDTDIKSVDLESTSEFNSLCNSSATWTATVGGGSVTVSNDSTNCIVGIKIGSKITYINEKFLAGCPYMNLPLNIPDNVTRIMNYFLNGCSSFNQPLTLSNNLSYIGYYFLNNCSSFDQPITLPSSLLAVGGYFLFGCNNMVSSVDVGSLDATIAYADNYSFATTNPSALCYTTGIQISGDNRLAWLSRFPDRTSPPYRKLKYRPK